MSVVDRIKRMVRLMGRGGSSGLTIVELVVFVGIGSAIILALVMMTTRAFDISRRELEQGALTEKARKEIERMSDEIRNAQYVDCNIDADTADPGEHWLVAGDAYSITLYSNVDDDVEAERVRYFVEKDNPPEKKKLKRGVIQRGATLCDFSGTEDVQVVLNKLNNVKGSNDSTPLFRYFLSGNNLAELAVPIVTLNSVLRVGLEMEIEETDINPKGIKIATDVVPRSVENPAACFDPGVFIERYQYTSTTVDFADAAYNDCQSYCMTNPVLPVGQCCGWSTSFSWQGNPNWYVWASCQCEDTYLPPDLTPESVNVGGYTNFAKECLGGTRCGGQMGEPICDAGCLSGSGDCVCVCPAGWSATTACSDGVDNDNDGTIDFTGGPAAEPMDPGCSSADDASESGTVQCDDGVDNDNDTFVDFQLWGGDPNCVDLNDDVECGPTEVWGVPQCDDGIDNECHEDGIDFSGGDLQCVDDTDNNEWSLSVQCDDGLDNDGDGAADCVGCAGETNGGDLDCVDASDTSEFSATSSPDPPAPTYQCSDDIDNDGDGNVDFDGGTGGDPIDLGCVDSLDDDESDEPTSSP